MTKLQFNLFLNSLQKRLFTTSSSTAAASLSSVDRLIDTYGLPSESAIQISKKLKISSSDETATPDAENSIKHLHSLFGILKDYGFSGNQIANLIRKRPSTLGLKSEAASLSSVDSLIDTYGLPSESAIQISKKLKIASSDESATPDAEMSIKHLHSVFGILKDYGFSGNQIAKLIRKRPSTLWSDAAIQSRLQFLEEKGFTKQNISELIMTNPLILGRGLETRLQPAWDFFRTCIGTDDNVKLAVKRWPWLLTADLNNTVQPNVVLLIDHGVPLASISKLIVSDPKTVIRNPERMLRVIVDLKESGRDPKSPMFIRALGSMVNMSEPVWNRKIEALKSIGLTEGDIKFLFRKYPICLACSEEKLRASFDFLVNTMKLDVPSIVARPLILMYGLEKRVRPRMNVLKVLKSKNLVNENVNLDRVMTVIEKRFLMKYVEPYQELVPELMDVYHGSIPA
ncbi:unnamed protein product [Rhodiola kirilowii]